MAPKLKKTTREWDAAKEIVPRKAIYVDMSASMKAMIRRRKDLTNEGRRPKQSDRGGCKREEQLEEGRGRYTPDHMLCWSAPKLLEEVAAFN